MRWFSNAIAAGVGKGTVKSESDRSSRKASDAKRRFDYAKREKDLDFSYFISSSILYIGR